jgi:predicted thioesterase
MKSHPKIGAVGEQRFVIESKHAIDFAQDGMPAVLCTPWLIWFLEHAAREAVLSWLEPGESTVGLEIEVRHFAPTPVGHTVTCTARLIHVDGARLSFQLEAHDAAELIARGVHTLQVIQVEGFSKRVHRKTASPGCASKMTMRGGNSITRTPT